MVGLIYSQLNLLTNNLSFSFGLLLKFPKMKHININKTINTDNYKYKLHETN